MPQLLPLKIDLNSSVPIGEDGYPIGGVDLDSAYPAEWVQPTQKMREENKAFIEAEEMESFAKTYTPPVEKSSPLKNIFDKLAYYTGLGIEMQATAELETGKTIVESAQRTRQAVGTAASYVIERETENVDWTELGKNFAAGFAPELYPDRINKISTVSSMLKRYGEEIFPLYGDTTEDATRYLNSSNTLKGAKILYSAAGRTIFDLMGMIGEYYTSPLDYLLLKGVSKGVAPYRRRYSLSKDGFNKEPKVTI